MKGRMGYTSECLLGTGYDKGMNRGVLVQSQQNVVQLLHQTIAKGVQCLGSVQLHQGNFVLLLVFDVLKLGE